jgi:uncharacterized Zn finger protein
MCSTCGCQNFTIDELVWYHQHCTQCGHIYKSTVEKSVCPKLQIRSGGEGLSNFLPGDKEKSYNLPFSA